MRELEFDYCVAKLAVVHDMRLIHTDLKPENILFISPEYVKVPDYKVFLLYLWSIFRVFFSVLQKCVCDGGAMIPLYNMPKCVLKLCQIITKS